jgi:hypothetical protein
MKLDVLANRDIRHPVAVFGGKFGDFAHLMAGK